MKKSVILAVLLASVYQLSAQLKYFAEGSLNFTVISNSSRTYTQAMTSDRPGYKKVLLDTHSANYDTSGGGNITIGAQYNFSPQISLESGLEFSLVNFNQNLSHASQYVYYLETNPNKTDVLDISSKENSEDISLFYFNIPVSAFYHLLDDQLAIGVGIIPGYLIGKKGANSTASRDFNDFSMGTQVQLRYKFSDRFWLTSAFQDYNTNFYKPSLKQSYSSNRMIKFGIRYDL